MELLVQTRQQRNVYKYGMAIVQDYKSNSVHLAMRLCRCEKTRYTGCRMQDRQPQPEQLRLYTDKRFLQ